MRLPWLFVCLVLLGCSGRRAVPDAGGLDPVIVSYPSGKETVRGVLHRPAGDGPFPAVVVIHGDFGLTDAITEHARRLAKQGYVTLAVDLYRGDTPKDLMDAHILDRALPEARVRGDLKAAVDYLAGRADVDGAAVGAIGWDSGGGNALDVGLADSRLRAVVTCYGRLPADAETLRPLKASVLAILAGDDEGIDAATREAFRAAMGKAGKRLAGLHVYPRCGHGFMNPLDPNKVDAAASAASAAAWKEIEGFFARELAR